MTFDRRTFLKGVTAFAAASQLDIFAGAASAVGSNAPWFTTDNAALLKRYNAALHALSQNTQTLSRYSRPVLLEGSVYKGVWLECAPHEGLVYGAFRPEVAVANHDIFFALQREDGYLPCNVKPDMMGTGQIQMVVPIAATALELARQIGDSKLLETAYAACSRWDAWLLRYRNTRNTGLCEGFCTYDTGHDNSPRWKGIPNRCPDTDARKAPDVSGMPRLCPDLSATVYGGRIALAQMARELGRVSEAARWEESAAAIRKLIMEHLYEADEGAFYDLDVDNKFVRIRGDLITRVLGEHVVDQSTFENVYAKQIHNPKAFWAPYPLPSIAMDDPAFVRPIPRNSWGGATQALTALRAPRWMEYYGKPSDLAHMMTQWVKALVRAGDFRQQMDPVTGDFTVADPGGYSPAALVFVDYVWRLHGVRQNNDSLEWNCRRPEGAKHSEFAIKTPQGTAALTHTKDASALKIGPRTLMTVKGTARVVTDAQGNLREIVGTSSISEQVQLQATGAKAKTIRVAPNQHLTASELKVERRSE